MLPLRALWLACLALFLPLNLIAGNLIVQVDQMRNDQGTLRVYLYDEARKQGFLAAGFQDFACKRYTKITQGQGQVVCENLPPGIYALTFFHDENDNFEVDSNFIGIPKEGYGFSLNYKPKLSKPSFKQVQFEITEQNLTLVLHAIY